MYKAQTDRAVDARWVDAAEKCAHAHHVFQKSRAKKTNKI
jgi:hypothetical protein